MFNTDQSSWFTGGKFTQVLQGHGVMISMSGKGRCADNILAERLWRTVKYEEVYLEGQRSQEGTGSLFPFYNDQRPHQALGYRTPAEVLHQAINVQEEDWRQRRRPPKSALVSSERSAGLSPNSASTLSN